MQQTVCFASVFHPVLVRGGAQQVAYELFQAASMDPQTRSVLLCSCEPEVHKELQKSGAIITGFDGCENEFLFFAHGFDFFLQRLTNPIAARRFCDFLREIKPDVIHFHHTLFFGVELLSLSRRTCPDATIAFTFHEFMSICHANGQMIRMDDGGLCRVSSPYRCHECFPDVSPDEFMSRRLWLLNHFEAVDVFIAPTQFLKGRYVDWGIPESKIVVIPNGQRNLAGGEYDQVADSSRDTVASHNRFAFFGQFVDNKGVHVLLEAVEIILDRGITDFDVEIYGGNHHFATPSYRERIGEITDRLAARGHNRVRFHNRYDHSDLPALMASIDWVVVPSTWWEVFGLVVSEAWMFGKPVIASDIGGLSERITHGRDGLLFRAGSARSLADTMIDCLSRADLWMHLSKNCRPPMSADEAWSSHKKLFASLKSSRPEG